MRKNKENKMRIYEEPNLLIELRKSKLALETAYSNFENATEPELIDCFIYEMNAAQTRYSYLLEQAKKMDYSVT